MPFNLAEVFNKNHKKIFQHCKTTVFLDVTLYKNSQKTFELILNLFSFFFKKLKKDIEKTY